MADLLLQVRQALQTRNLYQVAMRTGISYGAVRAIANGSTDPRWSTVKLLAEHLQFDEENTDAKETS